jgi:Transposase
VSWSYSQWELIWARDVSSGKDEPARRSDVAEAIRSSAALGLYREPEGGAYRHGSLRRITLSAASVARAGGEVRLIPARYVRSYVRTNKSDYFDAEAIAEAVGRPTKRFAPVKSDDQLDLQSLPRLRERWVMRRTAVVNQIRGLLLERGTTLCKGRRYVDEAPPRILAGSSFKLSGAVLGCSQN